MHVQMNEVTVTDPQVLASLQHPPELDAAVKQTCNAALGLSFPAGAEDGPGPLSREGLACSSSLSSASSGTIEVASAAFPFNILGDLLMCKAQQLPGLGLGCHAEKPVLMFTNAGEVFDGLSGTLRSEERRVGKE